MVTDTNLSPLARALYSRVQRVADQLPEWVHPAKALSLFKNASSNEEINYRDLSDLLTNRQGPEKIAKAEIHNHLIANPAPQIDVQTLAGPSSGNVDVTHPRFNRPDLNLPGGKNYTESLFKLSSHDPHIPNGYDEALSKIFDEHPDATADEILQYLNPPPPTNYYASPHWDTPNVLAHTREDIRPDISGRPGKFLQEVQSDWHQAGKELGYNKAATELPAGMQVTKTNSGGYVVSGEGAGRWSVWAKTPEEARQAFLERYNFTGPPNTGIPDAPFKDTWPDLTLKKHVLDVANSPDQQWLGFTKGGTQADRYNLSNHISSLSYDPVSNHLVGMDSAGDMRLTQQLTPDQLPAYIGKDAAERLLASRNDSGLHYISGTDLNLGGEGMHHFYDQVLPSRLSKILKPFGGKVEEGSIPLPKPAVNIGSQRRDFGFLNPTNSGFEGRLVSGGQHIASAWPLNPHSLGSAEIDAELVRPDVAKSLPTPTSPAWLANITPEMKEAIKKAGLPLMSILMSQHLAKQNALIPPSTQSGQ